MTHRKSTEYSLTELLEHPVLRVQMASAGIDARCLDLILDTGNAHHRFADPVAAGGFAYPSPD